MCRLFGMHAGAPVRATFWLLDAPDSLTEQSHREPDGAGIGVFGPAGEPQVDKQPIAAWQDREFAAQARALTSATFIAHVRYASTGAHATANTHPFVQDGRIFAHNGGFTDLDVVDRRLDDLGSRDLVRGQTDSERMFALITAEARVRGGDIDAGVLSALRWMAENVAIFSLNFVLTSADRMWALRYPDAHELHVLQRAGDGPRAAPLHAHSGRIHAEADTLGHHGAVVVASERMDDDPGWRELSPGELIRVEADLTVTSRHPLPARPRRELTRADLEPAAAEKKSDEWTVSGS